MTTNTTASSGNVGKTFESTATGAITLSIDASLGAGYNGQFIQMSANGVVTPVGTGGLTVRNRYGYTKTSGQYSAMGFYIDSTATNLVIWGDGAP